MTENEWIDKWMMGWMDIGPKVVMFHQQLNRVHLALGLHDKYPINLPSSDLLMSL